MFAGKLAIVAIFVALMDFAVTLGELPTVCHPAGSGRSPEVGDSGFHCVDGDGCNGCGDCRCDQVGLATGGYCTLMGCPQFHATCEGWRGDYFYESYRHFNDGKPPTSFKCKVGCNYCLGCTCDEDDNVVPGAECTDLEC